MKYTVSPYKLLINDGNYYLLAFDDYAQDMRTYRVDRMKGVDRTGEPREGAEAFAAIDLKTYTKRVFSMFGGKQERVTIRFINPLLDAVVDRFGNDTARRRRSFWTTSGTTSDSSSAPTSLRKRKFLRFSATT